MQCDKTIQVVPTKKLQNWNIKAYSPQDELLGVIHNEIQLLHFLSRIALNEASGYYIIYRKEKFLISPDGKIPTDIMEKNQTDEFLAIILGF